jgi:hypothetical protein
MYTHTHPVDQSGLVRYDFQTGQFSPVFASLYEPQKLDDLPVFHRFIRKKKTGRLPPGPVRFQFFHTRISSVMRHLFHFRCVWNFTAYEHACNLVESSQTINKFSIVHDLVELLV